MNGKLFVQDATHAIKDVGKTIWAGLFDVGLEVLMIAIICAAILIPLGGLILVVALLIEGVWWPTVVAALVAFLGFAYYRGKHPNAL